MELRNICASISYCCLTNHPNIQRLKSTTLLFAHDCESHSGQVSSRMARICPTQCGWIICVWASIRTAVPLACCLSMWSPILKVWVLSPGRSIRSQWQGREGPSGQALSELPLYTMFAIFPLTEKVTFSSPESM